MSPRMDSETERPLSSSHLTQSLSQSGSGGSPGSPSPGLSRMSQRSAASPTTSQASDSPIEVGGPISLTTTRSAALTTPSFGNSIFTSFTDTNGGFRPVLDNGTPRATPPLFLPPHLASLSSQFAPPLFPALKAFPGLCSCCPIKAPNIPSSTVASSGVSSPAASLSSVITTSCPSLPDPRSSSVAELRRKAQEHSAALLQSLHAAAAAGLAFPGLHLPPLSLHSALHSRKSELLADLPSIGNNNNNDTPMAPTTPLHPPNGALPAAATSEKNGGFRPVLDNGTPRATPPLFLPPHLASLSSQFAPPLFPALKAFPGLCSCCPIKAPNIPSSTVASSGVSSPAASLSSVITTSCPSLPDPRSSSVAELRRKAQEHSAALLQSLHAAAAAGLAFPGLHLPPLSLHSALHSRKSELLADLPSIGNNNNNDTPMAPTTPLHPPNGALPAAATSEKSSGD
uniref:OAR domain-containing protein n=1 Tax=Lutzomyia longipalpis TaxID=7200 RepID=A0A1B0ETH3_LUTLO